MSDIFNTLYAVDVSGHIEKKNGLSFLSWAWAWAECKKRFPTATYTIYENAEGFFYHHDGKTAWVKTGVTIEDIEHIEYLPVMDFKNKSIPLNAITSFEVNKAIQRSLTKALARHGLGLCIYAGEDLPEGETSSRPEPNRESSTGTPVKPFLKGETSPEEKAKISALLDTKGEDGVPVFNRDDKLAFSKMRQDKTAAEVIAIIEAEAKRRTVPANVQKLAELTDGEIF